MNAVITLLMGAVVGLGIFVVVAAQRGARGLSRILGSAGSSVQLRPIMLLIPGAFLVAFLVTGWIVIGAAAAAVMASTPGIGRRPVKQRDEQAIVEAIASWTEQLRDTLAGAHGLEQAIVATAKHAPHAAFIPCALRYMAKQYTKISCLMLGCCYQCRNNKVGRGMIHLLGKSAQTILQ